MSFHNKRIFLESMGQERPRKFARVQSTASVNKVNDKEPFRSFDELFDRCWARAFSDSDDMSDKCWARAFLDFDETFDKCWARAFSNFDENFDKCRDRCRKRAFSKLASDRNLDLLHEEVTDSSHQDDLTISHYSKREKKGAKVMTDLPEDIVVRIIAMAPFPSIFKAAGLSKAWRARFLPSYKTPEVMDLSESSTSDSYRLQDGENERGLATSFQKQVIGERSKSWETFSPVFIAGDHLVTYGQKSRKWRRISLSFLPEMRLRNKDFTGRSVNMYDLQIEGALLYISRSTNETRKMYVADILTQRWKQLPPLPKNCHDVCSKVVSNTSFGTYKVILFSTDNYSCEDDVDPLVRGHDCFSAHVYDSNSETWSTERFSVTLDFFSGLGYLKYRTAAAAYLNGVLYMVTYRNLQHLLAFNLAERTLKELELSFNGKGRDWVTSMVDTISLLVHNDNLLMIVSGGYDFPDVQVLEVGLHCLQLIRLFTGPPFPLTAMSIDPRPVSDGNCIFFRTYEPTSFSGLYRSFGTQGLGREEVLAYNLNDDAWSSFPIPAPVAPFDYKTYRMIHSSFQPSLSAFVPL